MTNGTSGAAPFRTRLSEGFSLNRLIAAAFKVSLRWPMRVAFLILFSGIPARAQSNQMWPEFSTFVKLTDKMRFYFLATTIKEDRNSTEGEFGPNFDFYLKPLRKLNRWGVFSL
jgi:hypothetical protein